MLVTILLLVDSTHARSAVGAGVQRLAARHHTAAYHDAQGAWTRLKPSIVLIEATSEHSEGALAAARTLRAADARLPIVLLAHTGSEALAIAALRAGFSDYVKGIPDADALASLLARWMPPAPSTTDE